MKRTVVAIEGGLYTSYTMLREYLHEAMIEILGEEAAQHAVAEPLEFFFFLNILNILYIFK